MHTSLYSTNTVALLMIGNGDYFSHGVGTHQYCVFSFKDCCQDHDPTPKEGQEICMALVLWFQLQGMFPFCPLPLLTLSPLSLFSLSLSLSLSLDLCRNFILGIEAFDASIQHERTCNLTQEWSKQYVRHTSSLSLCCVCVCVRVLHGVVVLITRKGKMKNCSFSVLQWGILIDAHLSLQHKHCGSFDDSKWRLFCPWCRHTSLLCVLVQGTARMIQLLRRGKHCHCKVCFPSCPLPPLTLSTFSTSWPSSTQTYL